VDDAIAIWLALAAREIDVLGLSVVFGNGHATPCAENAVRILDAAGRSGVPVHVGADQPLKRPYARVGWGVHGADGLDEFSTTGTGDIFVIAGGAIDHLRMGPADFGLPVAALADLRGGDVETNKAIALAVLRGEPGAPRDIVLANTALGLMAAGKVRNPKEGVAAAADSIGSGAALGKLRRFVEFSKAACAEG